MDGINENNSNKNEDALVDSNQLLADVFFVIPKLKLFSCTNIALYFPLVVYCVFHQQQKIFRLIDSS
jgi:hypothetical protein